MDSNVEQFKAVTGCDDTRAQFFLDAAGGNVQQAIEAFYSGQGDVSMDGGDDDDDDEFVDAVDAPAATSSFKTTTTTSSSSSSRPVTSSSSSATFSSSRSTTSSSAAAAAASKPRIATLGDLNRRGEDDEGGKRGKNEYFTGGGKNSGIAIQGRDDKEETQRIFKAARDAGARTEEEEQARSNSQDSAFGGLGFRLGESASVPPMAVGQSLKEQRAAAPKMRKVVVSFWKGGFTVDNGIDPPTLRPMLDPANRAFLGAIQSGHIPAELVALGEEIDLEMRDQRDEDFVPPKPKPKPFSGAGFSLAAAAAGGGGGGGAAAAAAAVPVTPREISVDSSKPTTKLQIRLADGTRMVASFNNTHTVGDVRSFVAAARPGTKPFVLMTAHPSATLTDDSATLEAAKLLNSVVLQKFV